MDQDPVLHWLVRALDRAPWPIDLEDLNIHDDDGSGTWALNQAYGARIDPDPDTCGVRVRYNVSIMQMWADPTMTEGRALAHELGHLKGDGLQDTAIDVENQFTWPAPPRPYPDKSYSPGLPPIYIQP
jgi:hypothetical protein